jgi:hypothetical protein
VQRAIDGDEVRPPATPEPELLEGPQVPLTRALDSLEQEGLVYGSDSAQALADELRLAAEYGYRDAAIEKATREAMRQESGYYELDLSERMASGQFRDGFVDEPVGTGLDDRAAYARQQRQQAEAAGDSERAAAWREEERQLERSRVANALQAGGQNQQDLFGVGEYDTTAPLLNTQSDALAPADDVMETTVMPREGQPKLSEVLGQTLRAMAESDARMFRELDSSIKNIRQMANELGAPTPPAKPRKLKVSPQGLVPEEVAQPLSPFGPMDLANRAAPLPVVDFQLPPSLANAAPRYGRAELAFASDLDRAAYILARDSATGASKAAGKLRKALEAAGLDPQDVARYGREQVQPAVKSAAGGGAAPQKQGVTLEIPDQGYQGPSRLPRQEVQRLKAEAAALDQELAALDVEIAQLNKQASDGGCN